MKTDKKKDKESFDYVELTKEEIKTVEGGDIIKPPLFDTGGGPRPPGQ